MTHQMAAEVEKQSYLSPSSSLYLPPQQESVTTDLPLSSLQPSPDSDSDSSLHLSSSVNNQNFDSNLALPMQSSSLLSNSASPSDQQSTFNGPSESLTDSFTQTTFTETPISTNYPDAMRSQITLLTTLLPEPVIDYLHHVNFSPSIFVILLMITITWLVMFITSKILSSHKEKVSLEDQLCRNHGENFNLKTERDYLFDELAAEKEKNSRLLKEHLEIKIFFLF
ncbi:uncharacterized protein LOC128395073 [Panonychus citri]|uniref:uncharacterized protein LOC128395073 n=1 Tax=Panonychus citri TaxID=50023 RepID=UPI002307A312|nr:uncharacterized protein LOC128395073 [Panonychus citri]